MSSNNRGELSFRTKCCGTVRQSSLKSTKSGLSLESLLEPVPCPCSCSVRHCFLKLCAFYFVNFLSWFSTFLFFTFSNSHTLFSVITFFAISSVDCASPCRSNRQNALEIRFCFIHLHIRPHSYIPQYLGLLLNKVYFTLASLHGETEVPVRLILKIFIKIWVNKSKVPFKLSDNFCFNQNNFCS
jgi:hypothetical protein